MSLCPEVYPIGAAGLGLTAPGSGESVGVLGREPTQEDEMADALILEFDGLDANTYERVNGELGIDMASGEGNWPEGLVTHVGAAKDGGFVVFEIWRSQADQERFMQERLAAALQAGGAPSQPSRAEWLGLAASHYRPEQG